MDGWRNMEGTKTRKLEKKSSNDQENRKMEKKVGGWKGEIMGV